MGNIVDLETLSRLEHFTPRVPGPVRRLDAFTLPSGALVLRWRPPAGGAHLAGYRIERTREGRDYECIAETQGTSFVLQVDLDEGPWFYRVTAFNRRGPGGRRIVWLFGRSHHGGKILMPIATTPGLRITIWELDRAGEKS